jgi:epoxyqueuosine reductase
MPKERELSAFLSSLGIEKFCAGDISAIKKDFPLAKEMDLAGIDHAVVMAFPLVSSVLEGIVDRPTLLYKHLYRQVNNLLDRAALLLGKWIEEQGEQAIPVPASQIYDWEKNLGHLSHRQVAVELGLGWYGRNNLLVTEEYGSHVRLATILTSMKLEIPGPHKGKKTDCSSCAACVSVCPVAAIHTGPADFDREACFAKTREFEKMRGISVRICGICVRACKGRKRAGS